MLISEQEERTRKFKLALRAGLPVLILIGLVIYGTFFQGRSLYLGPKEALLAAALVFITTYFIFFILEEDGKKTLVDHETNSYNYPAFLTHYKTYNPQSLGLLIFDNLETINENYGIDDINSMFRSLVDRLDRTLSTHQIRNAVLGRKQGAEFLIGCDSDEEALREALASFVSSHPSIHAIELNYRFGTLSQPEGDLEKALWQIRNMIVAQQREHTPLVIKPPAPVNKKSFDAREENTVEAIQNNQIVFTFRPLFNTKRQAIDTYEIAVTLQPTAEESIPPRIYLPIVNRLGFGREYDLAILKHTTSLLPLVDENIAFSFNLSPFSLRNRDFQAKAFDIVTQSGVNPSRLIIELYERKTHHNLEGYLTTLKAFRVQGFRICIDNFGSSNASMEYIRHFKFDMVQFDRDYVSKLDDQSNCTMLQSLVEMSQKLGITTVAKWVDRPSQKEKLIAMGIDYLQGFGIAKPLSETQLIHTYNLPTLKEPL